MPHTHALECDDIRHCVPYFHMLFDRIQIGIIIADECGTLVYYNAAQAHIDQLAPEAALGKAMCEVYSFTPETSPAMGVLRTGTPVIDKVNSYRTRSGNLVNASCTIYPLYAKDRILGVICYTQSYLHLDIQMQNVQKDLRALHGAAPGAPKTAAGPSHYTFASLVGKNKSLQEAVRVARLAANNASPVMLVGGTGVGKEIFAQSIHYEGPRRNHPYTAINGSAVPEALLEGILFGTTKGAFTGAMNKPGLFEVSDQGTLFFDEVDSMPVGLQSKLLRVLQEKRVRRVGEAYERQVNVRIISAVGSNPADLVEQGVLRPDFYYRLGVVKIFLPPLKERMDDLHLLVQHFLHTHSAALSRPVPLISAEAMTMLYAHTWPGNVRELEHTIEAAMAIMGHSPSLEPLHLCSACPDIANTDPFGDGTPPCQFYSARAEQDSTQGIADMRRTTTGVEKKAHAPAALPPVQARRGSTGLAEAKQDTELALIHNALLAAAGNRTLAARLLGISPQLLYYKLKKYTLSIDAYIPKSL